MPETWYFIGPDKTGFDCKVCCAGFSSGGGSCAPYPCSTEEGGYRQYICPNYYRPTPHHVYSWNGNPSSNVTIRVNDKVCSSSSTQCYSYTPSGGLNAAGRIGSGCSQQYVTSNYICYASGLPCPSCAGECCTQTGVHYINKFCVNTPSGCICSSGSEVNNCNCVCTYQQTDPEAPCYDDGGGGGGGTCRRTCPDGNEWLYDCDTYFKCPCEGDPADISCSGGCDVVSCVNSGYACVSPTYSESCPADFVRCTDPSSSARTCTCGQCLCTTPSTCCSGAKAGWVYIDSTCIPCYRGYEGIQPIDCCDDTWKRKRCANGEVCCNDGLCYSTNTVLCEYDPPGPWPWDLP